MIYLRSGTNMFSEKYSLYVLLDWNHIFEMRQSFTDLPIKERFSVYYCLHILVHRYNILGMHQLFIDSLVIERFSQHHELCILLGSNHTFAT